MTVNLINSSKRVMCFNNEIIQPNQKVCINCDENLEYEISLEDNSYIQMSKNQKHLIGYELFVLTTVCFENIKDGANIELECYYYKDLFRDYCYTVILPKSNDCYINIKQLKVKNASELTDQIDKLELNRSKKHKKLNKADLVLSSFFDSILFGTPLVLLLYFATKHVFNMSFLYVVFACIYILIFVFGMAVQAIINKKSKKKNNSSIRNSETFFDEKNIRKIIFNPEEERVKL